MREGILLFVTILTLASAFYVAFSKNLIYTAFSLLVTLTGVAALYVFLGADFLAGIQLLLYVGGVLVITVFAIMLSAEIDSNYRNNPSRSSVTAVILLLLFLAGSLYVIWTTPWVVREAVMDPTTDAIGNSLLTTYLLPFEVISLLLLVALLGAVGILRPVLHQNRNTDEHMFPGETE